MRQQEIPIMSPVKAPEMVSDQLIQACANARQALSLCIRLSGYTDETVADLIGVSKGHLSKILNGRASLQPDQRIRLMYVCGNLAPLQFDAWAMGRPLVTQHQDRRQQYTAGIPERRVA